MEEKLLTRKELAAMLRISQHRLHKLLREGLPYIPMGGGEIRFSPSAIEKWLEERARKEARNEDDHSR